MKPTGSSTRRAAGFSLLEVLLATSILVGCLAVLSELAALGRRNAEEAQELTTAQAVCETHLNEILAGIKPAEPAEEQPVEGHPGWLYRVAVEQLPPTSLLQLEVTVQVGSKGRHPREFTLVHLVRDPAARRREELAGAASSPPISGGGGP